MMAGGVAAITDSFILFARQGVRKRAAGARPGSDASLAARLFALQAVVVAVVLGGFATASYLQLGQATDEATGREMLGIARTLADAPEVRAAVGTTDPTVALQPLADQVQ